MELPEHQIFSVLRQGTEEPVGPYSQNELVELLNVGEIKSTDLVFYPELDNWAPISEVFELHQNIANFEDHGQDRQLLADAFGLLSDQLEDGESIFYIAVQHFPVIGLTSAVRLTPPKSLALSNLRFWFVSHKLIGGMTAEEVALTEVSRVDLRVKEGDKEGVFSILLTTGDRIELDKIPVAQLERLEHLTTDLLNATEEEAS